MNINRREFNCALVMSVGSVALRRFPAQTMRVNGKRIMDHIVALAEFAKNPQGGASRVAYSDADKQGREYVLGLLRAAKLDVKIDAAGNLIGRRAGSASNLKPLLVGSHIDTVPEGGNYDGVVGSLGRLRAPVTTPRTWPDSAPLAYLRPERRRNQPLSTRILSTGRYRERCERTAPHPAQS
jgi:hypothetical protein